MPSLREYKRGDNKLLPHGASKPEIAQFTDNDQTTRKAKQCHLID